MLLEMSVYNYAKLIGSIGCLITGVLCGAIELRKNPEYWLNRFFAMLYIFSGLGFLLYTIYHLIFSNPDVIIPIMISAQLFYNLGVGSMMMTVFILEKSQKVALNSKYLTISFLPSILLGVAYLIWRPTLNMEKYSQGIVDTDTSTPLFIVVNFYRIGVVLYIMFRYIAISKKAKGKVKQQMKYFSKGTAVIIFGMFLNLFGGSISSIGIYLEIAGLLAFIVGLLITLKAFLIK